MRRIAVGVGGIALAALLVGGLVTGIGSAQSVDSGTNASLGADVSAFMQASGAETEDELDDEMFDAALNRTTDPDERRALLEERKERLEARHQTLRNQRETLDGEPSVRTHAVATRIAIGASGLERSVNNTETVAREAGVDTERLNAIRSNASELRGPEIAELARGLGGLPAAPGGEPPGGVLEENRTGQNRSVNETDTPPESAANRLIEGNNQPVESDARTVGRPEIPQRVNESRGESPKGNNRGDENRGGPPRGNDRGNENNRGDANTRGNENDREDVTESAESAAGNGPRGQPGGNGPGMQIGRNNGSSAEARGFDGPDRDRGVSIAMVP